MRPERNLAAVAGLVLGVVAVVGYYALVLQRNPALAPVVDFPFVSLALAAAGIVLSAIGIWRAYGSGGRYRGRVLAPILGTLNLLLTGFFLAALFVVSYDMPESAAAPAVGSPAPPFELADHRGQSVRLSDLRGRNLVLVFYRGFW
jgi:hypothetical protein